MNGNRSVSGLASLVGAGALVILWSPVCQAGPVAPTPGAPNSFSTGGSFFPGAGRSGFIPTMAPSFNTGAGMQMNPRFAQRSAGPAMMSSPGAGPALMPTVPPVNQFPTGPGYFPGSMPVLNSNTLPALNSNTLPALNSNTLPLLNQPVPYQPINPLPTIPPGTGGLPGAGGGIGGGGGSGANCPLPPANPGCPVFCPPGWNWFPWGSGGTVLWNGTNFVVFWNGWPVPTYVPGPFGGQTYLYDTNLLPGASRAPADSKSVAQAPPQPTPFEIGIAAFRAGNGQAAVKILTDVVAHDKEDTIAMRVLSLALLEQREPDNAAAMMRQAYKMDPTLASRVVEVDALALTSTRRTMLINRAVEYANRVGSASGWLTVAVLMQADGRFELARRMIKRAGDEGLEPAVRKAFDAAISARVPQAPQRPAKPAAVKPSVPAAQPAAPAVVKPAEEMPAQVEPEK